MASGNAQLRAVEISQLARGEHATAVTPVLEARLEVSGGRTRAPERGATRVPEREADTAVRVRG